MDPSGAPASRFERIAWPTALFCVIAARAAIGALTAPHNDEAYYWAWSRQLASSYFDHPPMVAYALAAARALCRSSSPLVLHLPALVLGAATSLLVAALARELFPDRPRLPLASALVFNVVPLFSMGSMFTTPDAPLAFFWVLALLLFWRALEGRTWAFYATGAAIGLGLFSKYNMVLLPPSLLLFLATTRHRVWLRRKEPYLALALAALFVVPVLVWNARHDWASFAFHLVERHRSLRPLATLGRFVASQLAISPLLLAVFLWGGVRSHRRGRAGDDAHWLLFCAAAPTLGFFAAVSLRTFTLPNWTAPGYLTLVIAGTSALLETRARAIAAASVGLGAAMSALLHAQSAFWLLPLPLALEPSGEQRAFAEVAARFRERLGAMPPSSFAFTSRFQSAALLAYYAPEIETVTRISGRRDQYDYWRDNALLRGRDGLYLADERSNVDPAKLPFERCEILEEVPIAAGGRLVRKFAFWGCAGYRP